MGHLEIADHCVDGSKGALHLVSQVQAVLLVADPELDKDAEFRGTWQLTLQL